jgi:hypothetical protein
MENVVPNRASVFRTRNREGERWRAIIRLARRFLSINCYLTA